MFRYAPSLLAFDVHFHPADRLAVVRLAGQVTGAEVLEATKAVLAGGWEPGWSLAVDLREAAAFRVVEADAGRIGAVMARIPQRGGGGRTVFLVRGTEGDAAARRILRISEVYLDRERRIHYNAAAAAEWLGVSASLLEPAAA